ncbi:hypothetical protein JZ751_025321 [Albula glossodonta]|uniref:Uncharacterized protein n=1 Tax=Albula glossodonta TaxID=121402 RepID=A0A8T2NIT9_9TELE|nr:hypothetical protein JZ751_025321 [Albula glossodonta]
MDFSFKAHPATPPGWDWDRTEWRPGPCNYQQCRSQRKATGTQCWLALGFAVDSCSGLDMPSVSLVFVLAMLTQSHKIPTSTVKAKKVSTPPQERKVAIEGDVYIHVVAVDGVLPLALVEPHPHLVVLLQGQHDALALHDTALAGLRVHDHLLLVVLHYVQVGLLVVPGVDVDVEVVDPWRVAVELALEHVEVLVEVDEDSVKDQGLVVLHAVEGLPSPHRESRVLGFAGVSRGTGLALTPFGTHGAVGSWRALFSGFPWCPFVPPVTFVSYK